MRQPEFWKAEVSGRDAAHALRAVLTPISWVYAWAAAQRIASTTPRHAPIPVVCVGNLTVGGSGKTPIVRAVRARLGPGAHTLSRGYGGRLTGPLRVTTDMSASEVGDEPLLHAADGPAWISRDRVAGALAAANAGAHALVLDDGYQNPALAKDFSFIAVDSEFGVGNRQVFPAGPLRERLAEGLARADAAILIGSSTDIPGWLASFQKPILRASLRPTSDVAKGKLIAFAGIAQPQRFFDSLSALGAELEDGYSFADHHLFTEDNLTMLANAAQAHGAKLITTEKDYVRLSPAWRARVAVLPVVARFEDEGQLDALLAPIRSRMNQAGSAVAHG